MLVAVDHGFSSARPLCANSPEAMRREPRDDAMQSGPRVHGFRLLRMEEFYLGA